MYTQQQLNEDDDNSIQYTQQTAYNPELIKCV